MKRIYPFSIYSINQYNDLKYAYFEYKFLNIKYCLRYLDWDEWQIAILANESDNSWKNLYNQILLNDRNKIKNFIKILINIKELNRYKKQIELGSDIRDEIITRKVYNVLILTQQSNIISDIEILYNDHVYYILKSILKILSPQYTEYIKNQIKEKFGHDK